MHSTRTSTALFGHSEAVTANNHFDEIFEIITIGKVTIQKIHHSTVRISGPPELTIIVCSNWPIIPPSWHPNA